MDGKAGPILSSFRRRSKKPQKPKHTLGGGEDGCYLQPRAARLGGRPPWARTRREPADEFSRGHALNRLTLRGRGPESPSPHGFLRAGLRDEQQRGGAPERRG